MKRTSGGFTLIELLIVVAIIGILAAIAIPNFLNAQVRAKVATVKAELNSLHTAIESYAVDYGSYPLDWNDNSDPAFRGDGWDAATMTERYSGFWQWVSWAALNQLTTPIEYLSSVPGDPFWDDEAPYSYDAILNGLGLTFAGGWLVASMGPDRIAGDWPIDANASIYAIWYDPSNGTISDGDIWRTDDALSRYGIDY